MTHQFPPVFDCPDVWDDVSHLLKFERIFGRLSSLQPYTVTFRGFADEGSASITRWKNSGLNQAIHREPEKRMKKTIEFKFKPPFEGARSTGIAIGLTNWV
jgi:hypothetical protein